MYHPGRAIKVFSGHLPFVHAQARLGAPHGRSIQFLLVLTVRSLAPALTAGVSTAPRQYCSDQLCIQSRIATELDAKRFAPAVPAIMQITRHQSWEVAGADSRRQGTLPQSCPRSLFLLLAKQILSVSHLYVSTPRIAGECPNAACSKGRPGAESILHVLHVHYLTISDLRMNRKR